MIICILLVVLLELDFVTLRFVGVVPMLSICSVAVRKTYALFLLYIFMSMSCVLIAIYNRMSVDVSIQVYVCGGITCY